MYQESYTLNNWLRYLGFIVVAVVSKLDNSDVVFFVNSIMFAKLLLCCAYLAGRLKIFNHHYYDNRSFNSLFGDNGMVVEN